MSNRILAAILTVICVSFLFSGCSSSADSGGQGLVLQNGGNDQQPVSQQGGTKTGLLEGGGNNKSDANQSSAEVSIGGASAKYVLKSCTGSMGWNAMYISNDNNGKYLGAVTLTIPMSAKAGDVFRQNDSADFTYGNGSVMYYNARTAKRYLAMDTAVISQDYDTTNLIGQSSGNEFAIAIDSVSNNGTLFTGRFAAQFVKNTDGKKDDVVISDSTFTLDVSGAAVFTPKQGDNTDIDSFFNGDDLKN